MRRGAEAGSKAHKDRDGPDGARLLWSRENADLGDWMDLPGRRTPILRIAGARVPRARDVLPIEHQPARNPDLAPDKIDVQARCAPINAASGH
jgi:hypothetical protein